MGPLEAAAVVSGIVAVWLTARENVWCWPIGLVNVSLSALLFWEAKLYADAGLQLVYVVLCLYGWWSWLHGGREGGLLTVSRMPTRSGWALASLAGAFAAVLGYFLSRQTDAALPFWDSSTAAFSLAAQWMQARKWIENWVVWIAVDVVYVGMYVVKGLAGMAGLYAIFTGLAVVGLVSWARSLSRAPAPA